MSNDNDKSQMVKNDYSLHGDIIGGDKVYSNSTSSKILPVSKGILNETTSSNQEQLGWQYRSVFLTIERRPEDGRVKKGELHFIAENILAELLHESSANLDLIGQWLKQLHSLALDVYQTTIAVLTNPSNGLSEPTRLEIEKIRKECEPTVEMTMPINVYLENELNASQVSPAVSAQMRGELEELQQAVYDGNIKPVRQLLVDLTTALPGMKLPLRHWLVDSTGIPTAIKVFARNYLDSV